MPSTADAAAVTDAYRGWLVALVTALRRRAAADMVDMDASDVDRWMREWLAAYTPIVDGALHAAAARAAAYLVAYLTAEGIDPGAAAAAVQVATGHVPGELDRARVGALWRLGRGDGQTAARVTAAAVLEQVVPTMVYGAARAGQQPGMDAHPRIVGYRRVTSAKPCGACLSRSGEFVASADPPDTHDRCSCTGEPVLQGVPERVRRPTGQERVDAMSDDELAALVGPSKAAVVRSQGVSVLAEVSGGQLVEPSLRAIGP